MMPAMYAAISGLEAHQTMLDVTANNLANVDTPGYQRQDVNFQGTLQSAIQSGQPLSQVAFTPYTQAGTSEANGNGINSQQESADLAENGLLYKTLTGVAASREQILISAIGPA